MSNLEDDQSLANIILRLGTRQYVSNLLGVSYYELEAYIAGVEVPPTRVLKKLARAAGIPLNQILPREATGFRSLWRRFRRAPDIARNPRR